MRLKRVPNAPDGGVRPSAAPVRHRPGARCAAVLILAAVTALFFLPLARGETFLDVASRQSGVYPWAAAIVDPRAPLHFDQADTFYPWQVFINRALRSGELPLWNPYSFTGQPFLANATNGALYPPRALLSLLAPPERVHDLLVLSHMLLGGTLMLLLLASIPLSLPAALFGAVAWMLNSFMLAWMALEHYVVIEAWLPLAVLLLDRAITRQSWPASVALGAVLALVLLGGNVLFVELTLVALAALTGWLLARRWWRRLPRWPRRTLQDVAIAAAPFLLMGALAAAQLLPAVDLVRSIDRAALPYDQLTTFSLQPPQLVFFFLPIPRNGGDVYHTMLFLGTPTAPLAILGALRPRHRLAHYARWLAPAVLLVALGTPLTWLAYQLLPGFGSLKPLGRVLFLFDFVAALLAAFGLDALLRHTHRDALWRSAIAGLLTAVVVAQMHDLSGWVTRHQPSDPAYRYPETPLLRSLGAIDQARILPVLPKIEGVPAQRNVALNGSTAMIFGLQNAAGYDSLLPARTTTLWRVVQGNTPGGVEREKPIWAYDPLFLAPEVRFDLLPRLGVTDVVTPPQIERDLSWSDERFGPTRLDLAYDGPDGRVYRVADPLPLAYVVASCERVADPSAALARFTDPTHDAKRAVVIESGALADAADCRGEDAGAPGELVGDARTIGRSLNALTLQVSAARSGWLVVTESWDPGWTATVDGQAVPLLPGNYAFRTLPVGAGEHTVELRYRPTAFVVGAAVSVVALILVLALAAGAVVSGWRPPVAAPAPRRPPAPAGRTLPGMAFGWHRRTVAGAVLVALIAAYHQWLAPQFANAFFVSDSLKYLLPAAQLTTLRPDPTVLAGSLSPVGVVVYALILRATGASVSASTPQGFVAAVSSPTFGAALALLATALSVTSGVVALRLTRSGRAALLTTILAGLYPPFVILSQRALTDIPFALLGLLAILWVSLAVERRSVARGVGAGVLLALTIGTRLQYLLPLAVPILGASALASLVLAVRGRWRLASAVGSILLSFVALWAGWSLLIQQAPADRRLPAGDSLIVRNSPFAFALTDGWEPDYSYTPLAPGGASAPERDAEAILRGAAPECSPATGPLVTLACLALRSPTYLLQAAALDEHRLWWYASNDLQVDAGPVTALAPLYHRLLVVAGVFGCLLLLLRQPVSGALLAAPVAFVAALFAVQHVETRYAIPAMPSLIVGTAVLALAIADTIRSRWRSGAWLAHPAVAWRPAATAAVAATLAGLLSVGLVATTHAPMDQWSATLRDPQQRLIQRVARAAPPSQDQRFAVLLDVEPLEGDLSDLAVALNGHPLSLLDPANGLVFLTQQETPQWYYRPFYELSRGARDARRAAQWVAAPAPSEWVRQGDNEISVSLRASGSRPHPVRVFGQLSDGRDRQLWMPSPFMTSVWRYLQDGEARIQSRVTLASTSRSASYSPDGGRSLSDELSPEPGPKHGTYRIFLAALSPAAPGVETGEPPVGGAGTGAVSATLEPADPGPPVDALWFFGSSVGTMQVTVLDQDKLLLSFVPGGQAPWRRESAEGEIAYAPYAAEDGAVPRFGFSLDGTPRDMTPADAAALLWYAQTRGPSARLPELAELPPRSSGVYVAKPRRPISTRDLRFVVQRIDRDDAPGDSWQTLVPPSHPTPPPGTERAVVRVATADGRLEYVGDRAPAKASDGPETTPALFLLHGGDLVPATTLRQAAALLDGDVPGTRLAPTAAPRLFTNQAPDGRQLSSYWSSQGAARPPGPARVAITLE